MTPAVKERFFSVCALPLRYGDLGDAFYAKCKERLAFALKEKGCTDIRYEEPPRYVDAYLGDDGNWRVSHYELVATGDKA